MVYYRAGSSAAHLSERDADAVSLFEVDVLHVSGITAALSDSAASFLDRLIGRARMPGVIVSIDVNYRPVLWRMGRAALALDALARRPTSCSRGGMKPRTSGRRLGSTTSSGAFRMWANWS
ncbi:sugar/nucleoside kinase (ribokinase family) [Microbacterium halimionae]|uniref:Sugar/nucleoside kinase (Ribokinase family) n=1 Tax=Microbacterium halimionae TaxID=1526413 RepID=A0A7W3PL49_9MICO|nr:hypothetical protein [Microbacterium halimionae]MBA8815577.1 sugar/nucleoside kinase (ribokinase family) [Microbacterium halimionae]NII95623.1 sugar/nucleoside kinase (ribokinase family) [Microbacterium halimionae]